MQDCKINQEIIIDEVIFQVELSGYIKSRIQKDGFRTRPYVPNRITSYLVSDLPTMFLFFCKKIICSWPMQNLPHLLADCFVPSWYVSFRA
jgi:hypothetical protein